MNRGLNGSVDRIFGKLSRHGRISVVAMSLLGLLVPAVAQEAFRPQDIPKQEERRCDGDWHRRDDRARGQDEHPWRCGCNRPSRCDPCDKGEGVGEQHCDEKGRDFRMEHGCRAARGGDDADVAPTQTGGPAIGRFVLYAERNLRLGDCSSVRRGDVGVRAFAETSRGTQLQIGSDSFVQPSHALLSPSVAVGRNVTLGAIDTDQFVDDGVPLGATAPFPAASMPPLPLAKATVAAGQSISVGTDQALALPPGNYAAWAVDGVLLLNPGRYVVAKVAVGNFGRIIAITGNVQIVVVDTLSAGRHAAIHPAFDMPAQQLSISVAGSDANGKPAASIGEHSRIRALLAVPHGTLALADYVRATGAFAGFDLVVGARARVEFQSGFPAEAAGQKGSQQLSGYFAAEPDPSVAPLAGPVPPDTKIALSFGLSVKNPAGLKAFIKQVSDPKSPNFRKHLTQSQFYATYGASDADYQNLRTWAQNAGLTITGTYPNKLLLAVVGTAARIQDALYVNLAYRMRADGSKFITPDRDPSLDLSVPILHITGLGDYVVPRHQAANGTGSGGTYRATDLRNAYLGVGSSCQKLDGTGQVIGIVDFAVFQNSDIAAYFARQSPPLAPANFPAIVAVEGGNPAANSALEATLDVELAQAMAPNAQILLFQGSSGLTGHLDDILHAMATSNPPLTVASCSLIFGRSDNSQQALDEMAAQGVSFFTAAGDFGDVGDPQNNLDMDSQTLVGGTFLNTNPLTGSPPAYPNPYYAVPPGETTWNQHVGTTNQSFGVTGGGIMNGSNQAGGNIFNVPAQGCQCWPQTLCCGSGVPLPPYQLGVSMALNGGSTQWRNFPDVAMLATQPELVFQGNVATNVAGTSLAAPLWAGFTALANQASIKNGAGLAGFLNTTLYDIGLTSGLGTDLYKVCFNDVTDGVTNANGWGSASGFKSVKGYDLTTGWGSPTCGLIQQLSTLTPLTPNQPADLIRFVISTGDDDLRNNHCCGCGGTGLTADVLLMDGTSFPLSGPLKPTGTDDKWDNNTTTPPMDFAIPGNVTLTKSKGIKGVTLTIHESYSTGCTADNWDMTALNVSIFNPPFNAATAVCQLALTGTNMLQDGHIGLTRFSESPGGSGVGPTATFLVSSGSGCPP
jgi:hypothetical protein